MSKQPQSQSPRFSIYYRRIKPGQLLLLQFVFHEIVLNPLTVAITANSIEEIGIYLFIAQNLHRNTR